MSFGHGGDLPLVLPDEAADVLRCVGEEAPSGTRGGEEWGEQTNGPDSAAGQDRRGHGGDGDIDEPGEYLLTGLAGRREGRDGARHRLFRVKVPAEVTVESFIKHHIPLIDV